VKLTAHLHLAPRLKNAWSCTSTLPVRLHVVVLRLSTGTPSRFYLSIYLNPGLSDVRDEIFSTKEPLQTVMAAAVSSFTLTIAHTVVLLLNLVCTIGLHVSLAILWVYLRDHRSFFMTSKCSTHP
jgi:hypothetical protein